MSIITILKNIIHAVMAVVVIIPLALTMGADDKEGTQVIEYETTNPYINKLGETDISAHRSGAGVAPQNTLMAFEKMLEENDKFGVSTYEFDVSLTKDGELIVLHNLTYDATSNAVEAFGYEDVYASDLTFEEAHQVLNMGENFKLNGEYPYRGLRGDDIPYNLRVAKCETIIDYIEANCGDMEFNYIIEIKSTGKQGKQAADRLYEIISERNMKNRVIWATFQPDVSSYMERKYPDMPRSAGIIEVLQFYIYARMDWDLSDVNPSYVALQIPYGPSAANGLINLGTKEVINYAHKNNIAAQYWTINNAEDVEYLINNGADCIMTDYPDMAKDVLEASK